MGRVYTASFQSVPVSAAEDLLELSFPANRRGEILEMRIGQTSDATDIEDEMQSWSLTRYASAGSGGSAVTPAPHNPSDAASTVTVFRNRTSQGVTPTEVAQAAFNVRSGDRYTPLSDRDIIHVPPSGILTVELTSTPNDALSMTVSITFVEINV